MVSVVTPLTSHWIKPNSVTFTPTPVTNVKSTPLVLE